MQNKTAKKFEYAEFVTTDGSPIAIDPMIISAISVVEERDEFTEEGQGERVTAVYTPECYWPVKESYVEALQVVTAAKTNNLLLFQESLDS